MINFKGVPFEIENPIMGVATFKPERGVKRKKSILIRTESTGKPVKPGYKSIITDLPEPSLHKLNNTPCVAGVNVEDIRAINPGDILLIEPSGVINRLWDIESFHNSLMISHSCNCRCLMCPQPPQRDPDALLDFNLQILNLLKDQPVKSIGLTGGEPTLRIDDLTEIIKFCAGQFPGGTISLLSNGRLFSDMEIVEKLAGISHPGLLIGVSLQADVERIHDKIMGAKGGFGETVRGLHNLALARQQVEIRVVILKQNYKRLPHLAEFIYRNFPFAAHIAFMGLEVTGMAEDNFNSLWIEPETFSPFLKEAVWHLHRRDLDVSIYNLPYCLLPKGLWRFARDSISDWKKTFLAPCRECSVNAKCPGVFSTSAYRGESSIYPL